MGWKVEAPAAGFLLAQQRGYYADAGLDVAIDTGNGSAAAISLVAGGAYDCASADISSMIEFNVANPASALQAVLVQYDLNPNAIIARKGGPISKASDLAGKDILGQPYNSSRKLFPIVARMLGIDPASVRWENVAPDIGDTRFAKGDFDAAGYFYFTGLLNLKARGMSIGQLRVFRYADLGLKSYGNALIVGKKTAQDRSDAIQAFLKASTRAWMEVMADPKLGAAAVKGPGASRQRADRTGTARTDHRRKHEKRRHPGERLGGATLSRMQATIDETVEAFDLKGTPTMADTWTDRYLPPVAERKLKA